MGMIDKQGGPPGPPKRGERLDPDLSRVGEKLDLGLPEGREKSSPRPLERGDPQTVELHIEALVLRGFSTLNQAQVGAAIKRELTRLFKERGIPVAFAQGGNIANLDGGTFNVAPSAGPEGVDPDRADPERIGAQIAQTIYGRLNR